MQDPSALAHVTLGYSPIFDRQRRVVATRLTVFPARSETRPDAAALLQALGEVWPVAAAAAPTLTLRTLEPETPQAGVAALPSTAAPPATLPALSLNVADEALLHAVLVHTPAPPWMIEVPAFMAADPAHADALQELHASGAVLLIKGRALAPLAPALRACFSHALVDAGEARAAAAGAGLAWLQAGVRHTAAADAAFQQGAAAVIGWPLDDPPPAAGKRRPPTADVQAVLALIQGVDREEPVARLEAILKRDPALAFKLMRYLNSAAFGLTVEINSFGHALMLLGTQRLKRWLALLLASSGSSPNARPMVFGAVRRGLLMEELAGGRGDAAMQGEMFICGVFSLLDRLLEQPLSELLGNVLVPDAVQQALRGEGGPYLPYLQLVQAIEQASAVDMREGAERLLLSAAEVNRSLLAALRAARQLDG